MRLVRALANPQPFNDTVALVRKAAYHGNRADLA
jgi:hypothetical protein